eukprot:tig00000114_g6039.t1
MKKSSRGSRTRALFRCAGPEGRGADGRTAARVACDAVDLSRGMGVELVSRLGVYADFFFEATAVLYYALLHTGAVPALAGPAQALLPHLSPDRSGGPATERTDPTGTASQPPRSHSNTLGAAAAAPPGPGELLAAIEGADAYMKRAGKARLVRSLARTAAGIARAARGDLRGARARFGEAARAAREGGQLRDEGLALLLQAAHAPAAADRARLAAAAAALFAAAGDAFHARVARAVAAAAVAPP